MYQTIERHRI